MKLMYLKSALKHNSLDVTNGITFPVFRVSVTIEPGRSLLQFVTTNCLIYERKSLTLCHSSTFKTIKNFSVKGGTLGRGQPLSHKE